MIFIHVWTAVCVKQTVRAIRLILSVLVVSALACASELDDLLQTVEARYNRAKTLQVLLTEQYTPPGSIQRSETGILMLQKPGRMRLEYTRPVGKLCVSDGSFLWLYTPGDNRAEQMKLRESEDMRAPLAFLLGKLNFAKEFRNLKSTREGFDTRITADPKSDSLPYSSVEFLVAPDGHIRELKVKSPENALFVFIFDQEKLNPPLAGKLFQFQPPPGVPIDKGGQ
jgi:outer membrane lipoprotein carrier protein